MGETLLFIFKIILPVLQSIAEAKVIFLEQSLTCPPLFFLRSLSGWSIFSTRCKGGLIADDRCEDGMGDLYLPAASMMYLATRDIMYSLREHDVSSVVTWCAIWVGFIALREAFFIYFVNRMYSLSEHDLIALWTWHPLSKCFFPKNTFCSRREAGAGQVCEHSSEKINWILESERCACYTD